MKRRLVRNRLGRALRLLARKITKRIHSSKQSFAESPNRHGVILNELGDANKETEIGSETGLWIDMGSFLMK